LIFMILKFTWDMSAFSREYTYFCNSMTKIAFCLSLLTFLLIGHRSDAQTDSTRPPDAVPVQTHDTGGIVQPVRHDSVIHHLSHRDSLRRDSVARVRRAIRDSIRRAQSAAPKDSVAVATIVPATTLTPGDSPATKTAVPTSPPPAMSPPAVPAPTQGPPAISFWEKVLSVNPYFNFTGQPVVEIFSLHRPNSKDSLFYLLVAILFYFALIRIFFEKYFNNLMTLFFRVSLRQQQIREQVLQTPLPSLLLNILFVISGGLYACYLLHYSPLGAGIPFWVLYLNCMLLLGTIYFVKFLVLKFIGWVFSISRATDIYIFIVFLVNKMLGIFLLPFLIVITFSGPQFREVFITISLAMIFVLWTYRILASYRPVHNEIKLTPFYFFLYLCAFEIAPLLLIYKVLLTYLEKVY
jgi:Domain of unknown function (DUF4271)